MGEIYISGINNQLYTCIQQDASNGTDPGSYGEYESQNPYYSLLGSTSSGAYPAYSIDVSTTVETGTTEFTITWNNNSTVTSYSFSLTDGSGNTFTPVSDTSLTKSLRYTGLTPSTDYTFSIVATNSGGSSVPSIFNPRTASPPPPPSSMILSSTNTYNSITASWTGGDGATSYAYVLNGSPIPPSTDNGLSGRTITFTGLVHSLSYSLTVTATNAIGSTSASLTITTAAKPTVQYNGPIANLTVINTTNTTATAKWTGCSSGTEYIYTLPFGALASFDSSTNTAFITSMNPKTTYPFVVKAISPVDTPMFIGTVGYPSCLEYSYDGITWDTIVSASKFVGVAQGATTVSYNNGLWIAGTNSSTPLLYSRNGFMWYASPSATIFLEIFRVASNGALWVAGGRGANRMAYSYDGITWTPSSSGNSIFTQNCTGVAWNGSMWVACGKGTNSLAYSYDGITWTVSPSGNLLYPQNSSIANVAWASTTSIWVAAGQIMSYSYDGITWTAAANRLLNSAACVATNGSMWVAGGQNGYNNQVIYSMDGITWVSSPSADSFLNWWCSSVTWNGSLWVASGGRYGGSGSIIYSSDGITWAQSPRQMPAGYSGLAAGTADLLTTASIEIKTITLNSDPNTFIASSITHAECVVSWTGGSASTTYTYTLNGVTATPSIDDAVIGHTVTFSGLTPSTLYIIAVTSRYDNAGTNLATSSVIVTTSAAPINATPTNLATTNLMHTSLTLTWTGSNTTTSNAYFFNGIQTTPSTDNGVSGYSANFTGLTPSTSYTIYIVATAPSGVFTSSSINVSTAEYPPAAWDLINVITSVGYYSFVTRLDNNIIIVSGKNSKLYKSIDSGNTWFQINPAHDEYLNTMCMSSDGSIVYGTRSGTLRKSIDGGQTFTNTTPPGNFTGDTPSLACSANGDIVLALNIGGLKYSTDGGNSWNTVTSVTLSSYGWNVAMSSDGSVMYCADLSTGVYVSRDTGVTWSRMNIPADPTQASFFVSCSLNGSTAIVVTPYNGAYLTTDTGVTCNLISSLPSNGSVILSNNSTSVSSDGTFIIVGINKAQEPNEKTYISNDTGATWNILTMANTNTAQGSYGIYINTLNEGFRLLGNIGIFRYTFPPLTQPTQVLSIACTDNLGNTVNATNASSGPIVLTNFPGSQIVYTFTQTGANSPTITTEFLDSSQNNMLANTTSIPGTLLEVIQTIGGNSTLSSVTDVVTPNPFSYTSTRPGFYINSATSLSQASTTLLINLDYTTNNVGNYYRTYDGTQYYTKVLVTVIDNLPNAGVTPAPSSTFILEIIVQDVS